ncbi:MAG: glycoside hydrolase family 92 protein [Pedobacter sp.]|nr:MAG: glycoside hydrolase family 92 protein [Pedobacter sp.]
MRTVSIIATICTYVTCAFNNLQAQSSLTSFVDPFIGTGGHGHVFLGANVPFGAVQLGPVNRSTGWDWCSGYNYSDSTIVGFSHTHLSGTGIGDLGDILVMPELQNSNVALFNHKDEVAKPGYYAVILRKDYIKAELTASERVGFHRYTFAKGGTSGIKVDLKPGIGWDKPVKTSIQQLNDSTLVGYRYSTGWAADQRIFFTAIFSKKIVEVKAADSSAITVYFRTAPNEEIKLKVGISPVSIANATQNIRMEIPHWNFDRVVSMADDKWNKELGKVVIEAPIKTKRIFYTSLYHTMIAPSFFNDHNGDYLGTDKKVYPQAKFSNLTTFSLWDTYRAAHPLFTILQPDRVSDIINSMLAIYKQQGKLPVWHLMGNETNTMVGNPAIMVVGDAILKGFGGFDKETAFQAMKATAMLDERGIKYVKKYGYIPADSTVESVAMGLEYSIADWTVGQVAKKLNHLDDYGYFNKRGHNYQNYYDTKTGFMRGRLSQSQWRSPFDPFQSIHRKDDFTEGNAWQYTWLVPQDVEGLIGLMGGKAPFLRKLDSLFEVKGKLGAEASPDISGLIGQYAHGNEPSHHITYMYAYAAQPWKTAIQVRRILSDLYTDQPDGLSGNEDVGQMSAWYVFSALGFYPLNPANGQYVFGSPVIDKARISLPGGKEFTISIKDNKPGNSFIQGMKLNGRSYTKSYLLHKDLLKGGKLEVTMGSKPSKAWGVSAADLPFSESK